MIRSSSKGYLGAIFLSYYNGNKVLQMWRFKATQIYYLTFCSSELQHGSHWAKTQGANWAVLLPRASRGESPSLPFAASLHMAPFL